MKLFWSWQDDWGRKENRQLIQDALKDAVTKVGDEFESADRPTLDHDTKGVPGIADIPKVIFEKIASAAMFVADVTPIASSDRGKVIPNPNVLIELGWAMNRPGTERMVLVLNTASGATPADLPFDIKHRRVMTYRLDLGSDQEQVNSVRRRLAAELESAIRLNLHSVVDAAEKDRCIGLASDSQDHSIWRSFRDGVSHPEFRGIVHAEIIDGPRAYMRIIPCDWSLGTPARIDQIGELKDPPFENYCATSGSFGHCSEGYVRYWFNIVAEQRHVSSMTMYFDETGEFWAFIQNPMAQSLDVAAIARFWFSNLNKTMRALDDLGASKRRRVEIGVTQIKSTGVFYPGRLSIPSRKELVPLSRTATTWNHDAQEAFVLDGVNAIRNLYGLPPASISEIREM